jgi:hypothetical protein
MMMSAGMSHNEHEIPGPCEWRQHCNCSCCAPHPGSGIDQQFGRANSTCCGCGQPWPGYDVESDE